MSLSEKQAYMAMYYHLEMLYEKTKSNELGGFLGSMVMLKDELPADQATWGDWIKAIEKCKQQMLLLKPQMIVPAPKWQKKPLGMLLTKLLKQVYLRN